ncbi:hypothetical protein DL546_001235 [Coniochaeta pulveracea]|uniref:DUF8021 domain-containing protein n=1 Tax=Coniochaeta pulveracea TaxID=177199 RepID=A0A420XW60_9PEZI|nr:hypothetical protein DL546_001235 [Coniochaeta pulveracea]
MALQFLVDGLAMLAIMSSVSGVAAACTREGLFAASQSYILAQASGSISALNLSTSFSYQENNKPIDIKRGMLLQPLKIDLNRSTADTAACASYTLLISSSGPKPYILSPPQPAPSSLTPKKTLGYLQKENWWPLNTTQQAGVTRELLKKYGDAYLDMWTDPKAADSISWGKECERVEGSQYTNPCGKSLPRGGSKTNNGNRRYVIDETLGSVDVLCSFDSLGSLPDSHEIRVEGGTVRYVHTVTV